MPERRAALSYRPDIDGLRAVAIGAVIAFHVAHRLVPAGFVGVDVFFVISGYLITGVVARELEGGEFTLRRFYFRRVRRIFPALAVMLAGTTLFAWLCFLPDEWRELGKELVASATFAANFAFWGGQGYFDWAAIFKPLLPLWSLGVEEQFYLVWPLFLALLWRGTRRTRIGVLGATVALSFALNLALIGRHPSLTFYLPLTRLWELGAGSLLQICSSGSRPLRRGWSEALAWGGALLAIASIFLTPGEEAFPGAWALLPVLAALLLVSAGAEASFNARVLSSKPFVFVGLISYPLYLWHWPLLAIARITRIGRPINMLTKGSLLAGGFFLAWLTYRFVETPIRRRSRFSPALVAVCAALAIEGAIGLAAWKGVLLPRLATPDILRVDSAVGDWSYPFNRNRSGTFVVGRVPGSRPGVIVFAGDSHMEQYWPRLQWLASHRAMPEMRFVTRDGCAPLTDSPSATCRGYHDWASAQMRAPEVTTVVISVNWAGQDSAAPIARGIARPGIDGEGLVRGRMAAEIRGLVARHKRVIVILSNPMGWQLEPQNMISRVTGRIAPQPLPLAEFLDLHGESLAALRRTAIASGAEVIDPLPALCPNAICPSATEDGRPLYQHDGHLRPFFARDRATYIDRVLE